MMHVNGSRCIRFLRTTEPNVTMLPGDSDRNLMHGRFENYVARPKIRLDLKPGAFTPFSRFCNPLFKIDLIRQRCKAIQRFCWQSPRLFVARSSIFLRS
jgi:hypothetical protein